jgi:hypothetical protein
MPLFPELEGMPLPGLMQSLVPDQSRLDDPAESELWLQEVAVRIAKTGQEGLTFLIHSIPGADKCRVRAILLAFAFLPAAVAKNNLGELKEILTSFLGSDEPLIVAQAIDGLKSLGFTDVLADILSLRTHPSPYVVGSDLRYLARHYPEKAKPILLESLRSPESIVRQNAIDELEELEMVEAVPQLRSLAHDPDVDVRQAAQTALANLE